MFDYIFFSKTTYPPHAPRLARAAPPERLSPGLESTVRPPNKA